MNPPQEVVRSPRQQPQTDWGFFFFPLPRRCLKHQSSETELVGGKSTDTWETMRWQNHVRNNSRASLERSAGGVVNRGSILSSPRRSGITTARWQGPTLLEMPGVNLRASTLDGFEERKDIWDFSWFFLLTWSKNEAVPSGLYQKMYYVQAGFEYVLQSHWILYACPKTFFVMVFCRWIVLSYQAVAIQCCLTGTSLVLFCFSIIIFLHIHKNSILWKSVFSTYY